MSVLQMPAARPGAQPEPVIGSPGYEYVPGVALYKRQPKRGGDKGGGGGLDLVLDWAPTVHEFLSITDDTGMPRGRYYLISVTPDDPGVLVRMADLRTGEAWDAIPTAGAGSRAVRDVLSNIITAEGRKLKPTRALESTGWHASPDGDRFYVWPDGRTFPEGQRVRLIGCPDKLQAACAGTVNVSREEIAAAVRSMISRGPGQLLHLAKGVRSLGQSLSPVRRGIVELGEPGTGKTGCLWVERALVIRPGWEPLTTKALDSTPNSITRAADFERDMPSIFNDLALNGSSSQSELNDARKLVEKIFRNFANNEEGRGGLTRDLLQRPSWFINSIPSLSGQPKILELFQESLLRRVFVGQLSAGETDTLWWKANARKLEDPLRGLGNGAVALLANGTTEEAAAYLDACDAVGMALLRPYADRYVPGWDSTVLEDVVRELGRLLGGWKITEDVCGVPVAEVANDDVMNWIGRSLRKQWTQINNAHEVADDLGTAVADAIRAALLGTGRARAHIRDAQDVICPAVPGQTLQAQGVRRIKPSRTDMVPQEDDWDGAGTALYYLPEYGALGAKSTELHALLAGTPDPRLGRHTTRTLPGALFEAKVSIPAKKGKYRSTVVVTLETGQQVRMILLPLELIWPAGDTGSAGQESGTGTTGRDDGHRDPEDQDQESGQADAAAVTSAAVEPVQTVMGTLGAAVVEIREATQPGSVGPCSTCRVPGAWCGGPVSAETEEPCVLCSRPTTVRSACGAPRHARRCPVTTEPEPEQRAEDTGPVRSVQTTERKRRPAKSRRAATDTAVGAVALSVGPEGLTADHPVFADCTATPAGLAEWIDTHGRHLRTPPIMPGGRGSDGLVLIDPAACAQLGMVGDDWTAPLRAAAADAGLSVGKLKTADTAVSVYRRGAPVSVVVVNLAALAALEPTDPRVDMWRTLAGPDTCPATFARRARRLTAALGIVPAASSSWTGTWLWRETNPHGALQSSEDGRRTTALAPVAAGRRHPLTREQMQDGTGVCVEEDFTAWARALGDDEQVQDGIGLDRCLSFLAGARDLKVPVGQLRPVSRYTGCGVFLADLRGLPVEPDLPHFADIHGQEPVGPGWYTNVTIDYAAKRYGFDPSTITRGYATGESSAVFSGFSQRIRDAYLTFMADAGVRADATGAEFLAQYAARVDTEDRDALPLSTAVKGLYKALIGKLTDGAAYIADDAEWLERIASQWWYRPEVRYFVIAQARVGMHRMLATSRELGGLAPLAVNVDCVVYPSADRDVTALATFTENGRPAGVRLGIRPGYCKPAGIMPADAVAASLAQGRSPAMLVANYDMNGKPNQDVEDSRDE